MKILFYSHSSTAYGATTSMVDLIIGMKLLYPSIIVHVVLPNKGPLEEILLKESINYAVIPHKSWHYDSELSARKKSENIFLWKLWFSKNKWQKKIFNFFYLRKHLEFAISFTPDYIYINSSLAPMGTYVATHLKIPFIWHHRETVNDNATHFFLEYPREFKSIFKKAELHIYTSQFLKSFYENLMPSFLSLEVFDGVRKKEESHSRKIPEYMGVIRLGLVGRVNTQKGQKEVIEVFKKLKNPEKYELHIIGGGDLKYIKNICGLGNDFKNIIYHGFLSKKIIFDQFDFLIMNSKNEAFGRVVAEANFYGIPAIAKKSGALTEIIKNNKTGFLYDTPEELLQILSDIEKFDIEQYKILSIAALDHFKENFNIEDHTIKIVEKIKNL